MGQIKEVAVNAGDLGISTFGKELLQVLKELAEAMDIGQEDDICAMCEHNSTCTIKDSFPDTDTTGNLLKWFDEYDCDLPSEDNCDTSEEFESYTSRNSPVNTKPDSDLVMADATPDLDDLLDSRSIYGSFKDKASWIQGGKMAMRDAPKWEYLGAAEQEALDNIIQKMGRILFGEFHKDNWVDIAGYATLVVRND